MHYILQYQVFRAQPEARILQSITSWNNTLNPGNNRVISYIVCLLTTRENWWLFPLSKTPQNQVSNLLAEHAELSPLESYSPDNLSLRWAVFPFTLNLEACDSTALHRHTVALRFCHKLQCLYRNHCTNIGEDPTIIIQLTLPYVGTSQGGVVNTRDTDHFTYNHPHSMQLGIFFFSYKWAEISLLQHTS